MVLWYWKFHLRIFFCIKENSSSTFIRESLMVRFWRSHKTFDCGWYTEVIFCSVPVILSKLHLITDLLSATWFTNSLPWSFIGILIYPCREMISYKKFATVDADLSLGRLQSLLQFFSIVHLVLIYFVILD